MGRIILSLFLSMLMASLGRHAVAQPYAPVRIAVLAPLYLDSAFNGYSYAKPLSYMPRYIQPGLDFYQGVMAAADSFQRRGPAPEIVVYDTKNSTQGIQEIMGLITASKTKLIIASITNPEEQAVVSNAAFLANIPVVSATYPNDVNIGMNPYFIILNPTLHTHIRALFQEARLRHPGMPMLLVTQPGNSEEIIRNEFLKLANKYKQKYREIVLPEGSGETAVSNALDSLARYNLIFCASLSETFAATVLKGALASSASCVLLGMPNWEGNARFNKLPSRIQVWNTCGFGPVAARAARPSNVYRSRYMARASEQYLRGYESMYRFTNLLYAFKDSMIYHLNDPRFPAINEYRISPNSDDIPGVPSYQENIKIFFTRRNYNPGAGTDVSPVSNSATGQSSAAASLFKTSASTASGPVSDLSIRLSGPSDPTGKVALRPVKAKPTL